MPSADERPRQRGIVDRLLRSRLGRPIGFIALDPLPTGTARGTIHFRLEDVSGGTPLPGVLVEFDIVKTQSGPHAQNVVVLAGGVPRAGIARES